MSELTTKDFKPALVRVSLAYTANMGAGTFESLRMDFGVEDYQRDGEKVAEAFERVYAFVENKLETKLTELREELKK